MEAMVISGARRRSHADLRGRAARGAEGLRRLGVGPGDVVALLLRNDLTFFEAALAVGLAGAYAAPINWHFTAEEVGYILRDSGAKVLLGHAALLQAVTSAVPAGLEVLSAPTPPDVAAAYGVAEAPTADGWEALIAAHPAIADPATPPSPLIYTSGTTGRPKGVRRRAEAPSGPPPATSPFGFHLPDPIVVLVNGPMYHSAPYYYGSGALQRGADIVLQARFDPEDLLRLVAEHGVTHMHIVPTMFVRLLRLPDAVRARYDLGSLRYVAHGAAPCPPAVKRAMIDWWGPVIHEYYGSTETGIAVAHDSAEALAKPGTVGRALPGCQVKVFDEGGRELGPGEIGEVYMRSPALPDFTYHGADDARREVGRDGLVTVGDLGYLDADGYLFLCDRRRDMVISGGVNIYPAEIEAVLIGMPGVGDCAVFGIPDEEFGEALCAVVEPDGRAPVSAELVRAYLAPRLARYKLPRRIELADSLPREDSGKIFKRKLRDPFWAAAGRAI